MAHVWQINPSPSRNSSQYPNPNPNHPHEAAAGSLLSLAGAAGQQSQSNNFPNIGRDEQSPLPTPSTPSNGQAQSVNISPDPGAFQCGFCKKSYTRPDHLIRHVRSHTQEKPYVCPICQKGFARPDLVKRHAAAHNDENNNGSEHQSKKRRLTQPPSASRVTQACKACSSSKLKCTEDKPCTRCRQKGLDCEYPYVDGNSAQNSSGLGGDQAEPIPTENSQALQNQPDTDIPTSSRFIQVPTPETFNQHAIDPNLSGPTSEGVLELDGSYYPGFLRELMVPTSAYGGENTLGNPYPPYMNSSFTPHGFMDYGPGSTSVADTYDSGDFPSLDSQTAQDWQSNSIPFTSARGPLNESTVPVSAVALGAEAFKKSSLGEWNPTPQDHGYAEETNLSLPNLADRTAEKRQRPEQRIVKSKLTLSTRDQILSIVLQVCRPSNVDRVVSAFPSVGFFDNLIQLYFERHIQQLDTWLHLPTFDPNNRRPELVTAIAGAGASRTDSSVVQRLGYALQESLRNCMPLRIEENNTLARSLEFHEAYFLQLDVRLWSGAGRKIELAEGLMQPGITMIRRGRKFKLSGGRLILPNQEDEGRELQEVWRAWAEQESRKRLSFHVFLHDAQSSITLNVNPLISYAEMSLPLPCSLDLWQAPDAGTWKRLCLAQEPPPQISPAFFDRLPSLTEVLQDMTLLSAFSSHMDIQLSRLIVLHALWALIWEHRQLNTLSRGQSTHWNDLVLSSRHREISVAVQHFRMNATSPPMAPEVRLMLECISMHQYMSLDELQLYAGKEDKEEARQAYYSARKWIECSDSRQAVWHAGQVVSAARSFRPNTLRDFYAIAVYHASLAFWSYGVVHRAIENEVGPTGMHNGTGGNRSQQRQQQQQQQLPIYLDGEETADLELWIAHKTRRPLLTATNTLVSTSTANGTGTGRIKNNSNHYHKPASLMDEPAQVMEAVRAVLGRNWTQEPAPPLVENLCQLMGDLGKAAQAVAQAAAGGSESGGA